MIVDVSNKIVVITGASKGIGRETAIAFAKEKAKVIINYYQSEEQAYDLYNEINQYNKECLLIKADVTNPKDVSMMYNKVLETFGRVDILLNNAGVCDDNLIQLMTSYQWQSVVEVNLTGTYHCCKEFSKAMIKQKSGKIINISSVKGQQGNIGQVNYAASKAGIIGLTKSLAKELGIFNIAVNAVCPGFIATDLNRHNEKKRNIAEKQSLLEITSALDDLIHFLLFLSSNCVKGLSGRIYNLDSRIN